MPPSPTFDYDVFLSHNHADKPRVRRLAERLKAAGVRVWLDEWVIKAGDIIALKVDEGLERSRVLLLCISPAALASGWVALERSTAVHRDPSNAGRRFIPVLLGECELPDTLRRYKYVDFREESEAAFEEVLVCCRTEVETPSPAPQPEGQKKPATREVEPTKSRQESEPLAVLEHKLRGHGGWVSCVAVSPDGKWVASGSKDNTVKIWDLVTGNCQTTLRGHTGPIKSLAVTNSNELLLSGSDDTTIVAWSTKTWKQPYTLEGHTHGVSDLKVFSKDHRLASCSGNTKVDSRVRIWDLDQHMCLQTINPENGGWICSIDVDSERSCVIVSGSTGNLGLIDLETGRRVATLGGHSKDVESVRIVPNERLAISGSDDSTLRIWDIESRSCIGTLEGHQGQVLTVAISPNGSLVASGTAFTKTIRVWDWRSALCLQVLKVESYIGRRSIAFSPDGQRLVVGTDDSNIYVYRLIGTHPSLSVEATSRYVNAKVVLLGEGTVGKTSLAHRLIEDRYVVQDRTHGMNVWRLDLPLPSDAALEREALLWDLAGQEDYRLIHQLFLDQTALALLLINPQKEDPFIETGDWIKALKTAANASETKPDTARLLIYSQIDVGGMKLGNSKIDRFRDEHGFANWLPTSAKTGENCSDQENGGQASKLKRLIAESIPWDRLPWTSTPRLLAELKNAVMAMRDATDIRLLRFSELAQRLEQALPDETFGESEARTAVTLLANHGLARLLKFGDLVLLRPDLLNGYAGAVIRAARAHTDEIGCVLEEDLYRPGFDFTGVERLKHRPDEELLLHALVQTLLDHALCIAEDTPHGRHLVFPSQYRRDKDTPKNPDIFVSYTFGGEWQTVWTTLVVRLWYSQEFAHRELWRNAAEFASAKGHTLGLLIQKAGDGAATISLYFDREVADELKVLFIEYVHRHLARYACDVARDRRYLCPDCGKPVTDLDAVRKRLAAKKDFITCQACDEKVPLLDFIEQRLKSDPVARKILAMDERATQKLDAQALEQILIGHMMAIAGEANQIFRELTKFDFGIDGEVEFKDNDGKASGKKIYIQLKSGNSYLRTRKSDGSEIFDVKDDRHLLYWVSQPVDVYLVIRQTDERSDDATIRWMNVTRYLKGRKDKESRQILFEGEKLDMEAVYKARDAFFPPT